jgi:uncharacterized protein (TIGR02001 family)
VRLASGCSAQFCWSVMPNLVAAALLCSTVVGHADVAPLIDPQRFDLAFGATVTSNYISKGSTQTSDRPAIQPYAELSYDIFYGSVWGSNVRFNGVDDVEIDLAAGIRPTLGNASFDIGFIQYLYFKDHNEYGEFIVKGEYAFTENFSAGFDYYREVYADQNFAYAKASLSGLPWDMKFSGKIGSDFGSRNLSGDKIVWEIGVSRDIDFVKGVSLDLRYYDGRLDPARFVVALSFDTTLSSLQPQN